MSAPIFSIIVLSYNRLNFLKQTVENLIKKTTMPAEFIFSDNGSGKELRDYLLSAKKFTNNTIKFAFSKTNLGISGGRNRGAIISNPNSKILAFLDDDILVPDNWDKRAYEIIQKIDNVGMTGVCVEGKDYPVGIINGVKVRIKSGNINGGCMIIPRLVFDKIGFFQTNYKSYGRDDTDMDFRLKRKGYRSFYIEQKGIHLDTCIKGKYAKLKKQTHQKDSEQDKIFVENIKSYELGGNYFVPYEIPTFRSNFNFGGDISDRENEKSLAIITTTDNCEKFIKDTIKSVIKQKCKKYIYLLIDIGGSDKTKKICKENECDFIKFISLRGTTLPRLYNYLCYEYFPMNFPYIENIAFLEQGDMLEDNAVGEIIKSFSKNKEVGAYYSGFSIIDEQNNIVEKEFKKAVLVLNQNSIEGQERLKKLFVVDNPFRYIKSFRLEHIYGVGGFSNRYVYSSDFHMFGKILSKYRAAKIDSIIYKLRKSELIDRHAYEKSEETKKVKKEFFNKWDKRRSRK